MINFDSNPYAVNKEAKEMLLEFRKKVFASQWSTRQENDISNSKAHVVETIFKI